VRVWLFKFPASDTDAFARLSPPTPTAVAPGCPQTYPCTARHRYGTSSGGGSTFAPAFQSFPWSASVYRSPGPCDGDVADGRILALRAGRDGTLLYAGRSDGGDSPFQCGLRNPARTTPLAQIDGYTNTANMQAQAVTNFMRVDAGTGEVVVGQIQVARLPTSGGNTLLTVGAQSDQEGNVYLLQVCVHTHSCTHTLLHTHTPHSD
jgi:hypothetical protein